MLTFLNSLIFSAAFIVLIPVLIHLLNRHKKKNKPFGSIRFIKILEKQRLNRINLYQYLLILIRTLVLLFLIFAFARPIISSDSTLGSTSASSTAVIILDTGIHMRYYDEHGKRFDRAVEKIHKILDLFDPEDQVFIILSHQPHPIKTDSLRLNEIECSYLHPNWRRVFIESNKIFNRFKNFNQELYLVTDYRQANLIQFSDLIDTDDIRINLFQIGDQYYQNIKIDTLVFTSNLFEPRQPIDISVSLKNEGVEQIENVELHLYLNEKREAFFRSTIGPGETKFIPLSFQATNTGYLNGYVEINDDALLEDNRYYFNLTIPDRIDILVVDDAPSVYLRSALNTVNVNVNVNITFSDYSKWGRENFFKYNKILLANFGPIELLMRGRLSDYLDRGGTIIMIPGLNSIPNDINQTFSSINSRLRVLNIIQPADLTQYYTINLSPSRNLLIKNILRNPDIIIDSPHFRRYFQLHLSAASQVLLKFSTGDAYLVSEQSGNSFLYVFAGYISDEWSDMHFKGIFLPLFTRLLSSDSYGTDEIQKQVNIGERIKYLIDDNFHTNEFILKTPENFVIQLIPVAESRKYFLDLKFQNTPGNYTLFNGGDTSAIISVNVPASYVSTYFDSLAAKVRKANLTKFLEDDDFSDLIIQSRSGYELAKFFIALVIFALLLELLIIKKIEN